MGVLEQIINMQNQGFSDSQIASQLREQGIRPQEISNALSQSQIKNAISSPDVEDMEPSVMAASYPGKNQDEMPVPVPSAEGGDTGEEGEEFSQEYVYPNQDEMPAGESGVVQPFSQEYQYPQGGGYSESYSSADTTIEIAEQVFSEKISTIRKKMEELNEFKTLSQVQLENMEVRLNKVESIIDKIHSAVLDKIASYGNELQPMRKEIEMMQDSFAKVINPLVDKSERIHHRRSKAHEKSLTHHKHKKSKKK